VEYSVGTNNYPKRYRIEFIEPGVCSYEDVDDGTVFVSRDTLDRMRSSFIGKPIVNEEHKTLSAEEAFKLSDDEKYSIADGVIYDCGWLDNGWCYADCMIWNISTQQNIKDGFSASCAYKPTEMAEGGKWHGFEYDGEVKNGIYTHMAIVNNPRYEGAKVYGIPEEIQNSKASELWSEYLNSIKKENNNMAEKGKVFNFFFPKEKKNEVEDKERKEMQPPGTEEKLDMINAEESYIDIDGEQVPLSKLIEIYVAEQQEQKMINPDDEINVNGQKIKASALADSYKRNKMKTNEETDKKKEKDNADEEDEKKKEEKQNNFKKLENAMGKSQANGYQIVISTKADRIAVGSEKYGTRGNK